MLSKIKFRAIGNLEVAMERTSTLVAPTAMKLRSAMKWKMKPRLQDQGTESLSTITMALPSRVNGAAWKHMGLMALVIWRPPCSLTTAVAAGPGVGPPRPLPPPLPAQPLLIHLGAAATLLHAAKAVLRTSAANARALLGTTPRLDTEGLLTRAPRVLLESMPAAPGQLAARAAALANTQLLLRRRLVRRVPLASTLQVRVRPQ